MTKLSIDVSDKNIECWKKFKLSLAEKALDYADEKGRKLKKVVVTDDEAFSALFYCVKEEGIFCWSLLWGIIERTVRERRWMNEL